MARRPFALELEHGVGQRQQAQRQDAGDDDGHGPHRARRVVQLDDYVHVVRRAVSFCVSVCGSVTAHKVLQDGPGVSGLHLEYLVVEFPILLSFVEICEAWVGGNSTEETLICESG